MSYFGANNKPKEIAPEIEQAVDEASDAAGFPDRSPHRLPPKRRRGTTKQLHNFTMRLDMDDAERFIRWCEDERLSYREGFAKLVGLIR